MGTLDWIDILLSQFFSILFFGFISHRVLLIIYRLYFHPLARFPGPKLTAVTRWYECYHQNIRSGYFYQKIDEMHEKYGPIVRINPFELHIKDSNFYDELYNFNPALEKRKYMIDNGSLQWTADHSLHVLRQRPYRPYFSTQSVTKLQDLIHSSTEDLALHFTRSKETGEPLDVSLLYRCCLADNICDYVFGRNMGFLEDPAKGKEYFDVQVSIFGIFWFALEIPYFLQTLERVGPYLPANSGMAAFAAFQKSLKEQLQDIKTGKSVSYTTKHRTIFYDYVKADLPPSVHTPRGFLNDANGFIAAGYETSGHVLSTATYHILSSPSIHLHLVTDLLTHWPNPAVIPSWKELEGIPYLKATVKEALRMAMGLTMRLARVNHSSPIRYKEWEIPSSTVVSMSQRDILYDPEIFADPYVFQPERWLVGGDGEKKLDKYLVSFSRGSRACIGKDLGMAEILIILGTVFRRFDLKLVDTERGDVEFERDLFLPMPKKGHRNVKVIVKEARV